MEKWYGSGMCARAALVSVCEFVPHLVSPVSSPPAAIPCCLRTGTAAGGAAMRATGLEGGARPLPPAGHSGDLLSAQRLDVMSRCVQRLTEAAGVLAPGDAAPRGGACGVPKTFGICDDVLSACLSLCRRISDAAPVSSAEGAASALALALEAAVPLLAWTWTHCTDTRSPAATEEAASCALLSVGPRRRSVVRLGLELHGAQYCSVTAGSATLVVGAGAVMRAATAADMAGYIDVAAAWDALVNVLGRVDSGATNRVLCLLCDLELAYESPPPPQGPPATATAPPLLYVLPCALRSPLPVCYAWDPPIAPPLSAPVLQDGLSADATSALAARFTIGGELLCSCSPLIKEANVGLVVWQRLQVRLGELWGVPGGAGTLGMVLEVETASGAARIDLSIESLDEATTTTTEVRTEEDVCSIRACIVCIGATEARRLRCLETALFGLLVVMDSLGLNAESLAPAGYSSKTIEVEQYVLRGVRMAIGSLREWRAVYSMCICVDEAIAAVAQIEGRLCGLLSRGRTMECELLRCALSVGLSHSAQRWNDRCGLSFGPSVLACQRLASALDSPLLFWLVCISSSRPHLLGHRRAFGEGQSDVRNWQLSDVDVTLVPVAPSSGMLPSRWAARFDRSLRLVSHLGASRGDSAHDADISSIGPAGAAVMIPLEYAYLRQELIRCATMQLDVAGAALLRCFECLGVRLPPFAAACAPLRLEGAEEEGATAWLLARLMRIQCDHYHVAPGISGADFLCDASPPTPMAYAEIVSRDHNEMKCSRGVGCAIAPHGVHDEDREEEEEERRVAASHAALLSELGRVVEAATRDHSGHSICAPRGIESLQWHMLNISAVRAQRRRSRSASWAWAAATGAGASSHGLYALLLPPSGRDWVSLVKEYYSKPHLVKCCDLDFDVFVVPRCTACYSVAWSLAPQRCPTRYRGGGVLPPRQLAYLLDKSKRDAFLLWASGTLFVGEHTASHSSSSAAAVSSCEEAYSTLPLNVAVLPTIDAMHSDWKQELYIMLHSDSDATSVGALPDSFGEIARRFYDPVLKGVLGMSVDDEALSVASDDASKRSKYRNFYVCRSCKCEMTSTVLYECSSSKHSAGPAVEGGLLSAPSDDDCCCARGDGSNVGADRARKNDGDTHDTSSVHYPVDPHLSAEPNCSDFVVNSFHSCCAIN